MDKIAIIGSAVRNVEINVRKIVKMAIHVYTDHQKERIKVNPVNRVNCINIRATTTTYYRAFQAAERARATATDAKAIKATEAELLNRRADYETSLSKFNLYKELFPDIVK